MSPRLKKRFDKTVKEVKRSLLINYGTLAVICALLIYMSKRWQVKVIIAFTFLILSYISYSYYRDSVFYDKHR